MLCWGLCEYLESYSHILGTSWESILTPYVDSFLLSSEYIVSNCETLFNVAQPTTSKFQFAAC